MRMRRHSLFLVATLAAAVVVAAAPPAPRASAASPNYLAFVEDLGCGAEHTAQATLHQFRASIPHRDRDGDRDGDYAGEFATDLDGDAAMMHEYESPAPPAGAPQIRKDTGGPGVGRRGLDARPPDDGNGVTPSPATRCSSAR